MSRLSHLTGPLPRVDCRPRLEVPAGLAPHVFRPGRRRAPTDTEKKNMNTQPGIIGRKLGCTQLFNEDGTVVRVTVIEAGPVVVVGKRTPEKDGYTALILGME